MSVLGTKGSEIPNDCNTTASTPGNEDVSDELITADVDSLGSHLTFYGSEPHLQVTPQPFQPPQPPNNWINYFGQTSFSETDYSILVTTFVLILSWEVQDPRLLVDKEIDRLFDVFNRLYHFRVERWKIPSENAHLLLNKKIIDFVCLGDDSPNCLKIVYYAGHGKLSRNRQPVWVDHLGRSVVWGGIQNALEQAKSDILILIDSCAAGAANTDQGRGVTELVAAGGFNTIANGVGPWSFTHALVIELELLSQSGRPFTISKLHNIIVSRMQTQIPEEGEYHENFGFRLKERYVTPIHVVLTEDRRCISRRIQILPKHRNLSDQSEDLQTKEGPRLEPAQEYYTQATSSTSHLHLKSASTKTENLAPNPSSLVASFYEVQCLSDSYPLGSNTSTSGQAVLESTRSFLHEMEDDLQKLQNNISSRLPTEIMTQKDFSLEREFQAALHRMKTRISGHSRVAFLAFENEANFEAAQFPTLANTISRTVMVPTVIPAGSDLIYTNLL
ncbi:hypothetical protein LSUE1_G002842 [Lachnellula suecica]|uniref:Caspase domain-containing protein n=1 Tax=Lachnellula suecica TaxID=602035 RepID=A0A8T9CDV8_9HELO|nr:hypothetical protein LSUE1_G002842 [Lachnellula suecica]